MVYIRDYLYFVENDLGVGEKLMVKKVKEIIIGKMGWKVEDFLFIVKGGK